MSIVTPQFSFTSACITVQQLKILISRDYNIQYVYKFKKWIYNLVIIYTTEEFHKSQLMSTDKNISSYHYRYV